jgi:hypothetical protein
MVSPPGWATVPIPLSIDTELTCVVDQMSFVLCPEIMLLGEAAKASVG